MTLFLQGESNDETEENGFAILPEQWNRPGEKIHCQIRGNDGENVFHFS